VYDSEKRNSIHFIDHIVENLHSNFKALFQSGTLTNDIFGIITTLRQGSTDSKSKDIKTLNNMKLDELDIKQKLGGGACKKLFYIYIFVRD
jgi:hypothetical protein